MGGNEDNLHVREIRLDQSRNLHAAPVRHFYIQQDQIKEEAVLHYIAEQITASSVGRYFPGTPALPQDLLCNDGIILNHIFIIVTYRNPFQFCYLLPFSAAQNASLIYDISSIIR